MQWIWSHLISFHISKSLGFWYSFVQSYRVTQRQNSGDEDIFITWSFSWSSSDENLQFGLWFQIFMNKVPKLSLRVCLWNLNSTSFLLLHKHLLYNCLDTQRLLLLICPLATWVSIQIHFCTSTALERQMSCDYNHHAAGALAFIEFLFIPSQ